MLRTALLGGAGWLAVAVAVNTVIGLYYYLGWPPRPSPTPASGRRRLRLAPSLAVAVGGALVIVLVLSVAPQLALDLAR